MIRFRLLAVVALLVLLAGPALADDGTMIDLGPVIETLLGSLAAALMALGSWALTRLGKRLGLEADSEIRSYLDEALHRAITWAISRLREDGRSITIDVKSEIVAHAVSYIVDRVPDAIEHFGLDGASVGRLIEARLPELPPAAAP